MDERHIRNIPALSEADMEILQTSHVLVVGCGGLGGNVIEQLARLGLGHLTVVDGDVFEESNLNRQLLCTTANIGEIKALAAAERVSLIDPDIEVRPVPEFITKENAAALMADADIVIDALDSISSRLVLEDAAAEAGLYLVHGGISGWDLQAMIVPPGSGLLHAIYEGLPEDKTKTSLAMTPAACASIEVSLAISCLCGRASDLEGKLITGSLRDMHFDTLNMSFE
ncbi:MAG: HesA/MoeB/ThiF family protein [Mogibacterium sp.]|nr:HesA/MoeB/ThiF family protein [Mogibacterium sp.]